MIKTFWVNYPFKKGPGNQAHEVIKRVNYYVMINYFLHKFFKAFLRFRFLEDFSFL